MDLTKIKVDLRTFGRRDGEYLLKADVLDHRFIDVPNAELLRAYDIELEDTGAGWVLARLDTRRPARFFGLIKSHGGHAARDWKAFEPMIGHDQSMLVRRVQGRVHTLKPAQIADLLKINNYLIQNCKSLVLIQSQNTQQSVHCTRLMSAA